MIPVAIGVIVYWFWDLLPHCSFKPVQPPLPQQPPLLNHPPSLPYRPHLAEHDKRNEEVVSMIAPTHEIRDPFMNASAPVVVAHAVEVQRSKMSPPHTSQV